MIADNFVSGLLPMQLNANKTAQFLLPMNITKSSLRKSGWC